MPQGIPSGQTLICCNPNSLNAHFLLTDAEVLALSSMEKPALRLRPCSQHPRLTQPLNSVAFADSRLLLIICEYLRIKGCDYLFAVELSQPSRVELSWIAGHYLPLYAHQAQLSKVSSAMPCRKPCTMRQGSAIQWQPSKTWATKKRAANCIESGH